MNLKTPNLYQNGVIDVFKMSKVYDLNVVQVNSSGDVSCIMDTELGKKTIKISGNLSASNFIEIPNRAYTKSLNFTGKYYYLFFKASPEKKFTLQLNFIFTGNNLVRFNFKYPLKEIKVSRTNAFNIDIPVATQSATWKILKFDPVEFVKSNLAHIKEFSCLMSASSESTVLRSIQAWSSIQVRGVYISNVSFELDTLPRDMQVRVIDQSHPYSNINFVNLQQKDTEIIIEENEEIGKYESKVTSGSKKTKANIMENFDHSLSEIEKKAQNLKREGMNSNFMSTIRKIEMVESSNNAELLKQKQENMKNNLNLKEGNNETLKKNMENINKEFMDTKKEIIKNIFKKDESKRKPLLPDPIMHLKFILGYTANHCPTVLFQSSDDNYENAYEDVKNNKKQIIFASGNNLINYNPEVIKQNFYFGHSKPITNYSLAYNNCVLISAQEGPNSIIRIWNVENGRCLKMLTTPYDKVTALTVSKDSKSLCTVGLESFNKELIIIWDISNLDDVKVKLRQGSHFPISCIRFSPFEVGSLVSCGRENIKFWRIKNEHLSLGGKAVVLNQYARNTEFLCMDFDNPYIGEEFNKGKLFVGSSQGCIIQISCNTQEMEAVYKIHDSAILCIKVNDAFCVTGSSDGYLRVWPVDFAEFLIEAKHDAGVCSIDISLDALEIICGTKNGSIGKLVLENKEYKTILRSPPNKILSMSVHPSGNYLFTIEDDKSVRVWDIETKCEAFQFVSNKDSPTCIAIPNKMIFACGFQSGALKVFDLEKTAIVYECKSFQSQISVMKFIQKDSVLITMNSQGHMSIHDALNGFIQIKLIRIDEPTMHTDISVSPNEDYFATIGPESNCVLVWNSKTFGIKNRVPVNNFFITRVCLISKNILAVLLENCCVCFFSLVTHEGILVKEFPNVHLNKINEFLITRNQKFFISGGEEGMIKVWDSKMLFKPYISYQQFIGHSSSIRSVIILESKSLVITASENSGIYFWNFLGDVTFTETEITKEFDKFGDPLEMKNFTLTGKVGNTTKEKFNTKKDFNRTHLDKAYAFKPEEKRLKVDSDLSANDTLQVLNMLPTVDDKEEEDFSITNSGMNFTTTENFESTPEEVLRRIYFSPGYIPTKVDKSLYKVESDETKLGKQFCVGYSTNSMRNLIYNKQDKWYAFTCNNKIIIEFLEESRSQLILDEHLDEISCLILSPDNKYLVSSSGLVNKDTSAPIMIWETSTFALKKRLNFHFQGVQSIKFSQSGKYMITIGTKEERCICIWNFHNMTVIDSKSLKFSPIDIVCEKYPSDNLFYFSTIAPNVISFWRMDSNYRLDGFHVEINDIITQRDDDEFITAADITPYYEKVNTSFMIVGTNKGAIVIVDKEKKLMIRKFYISKSAITKIMLVNNTFICTGECPLIYTWKFMPNQITNQSVFEFIEKEKPNLIFVDSKILASDFANGNEGIVGTDTSSIYFVNLQEKAAIKIISAHTDCDINSIEVDVTNNCVFTSGDDGTIRCWTQDSLDQKFQFFKANSKCEGVLLNPKHNICTVNYEMSYLKLYNMTTLKGVGVIKIPDNNITCFSYIFNYAGLIVSTAEDRLFVLDVNNYDPLSILYTEIQNDFIPKNQFFKYVDSKHITNNKSLVSFAFSDGTCTVIMVEKSNGRIEISLVDKFNMFEYHISKADEDKEIGEMYQNLTKYRTNYISVVKFSKLFDNFVFSIHECLQFLFIRDYNNNEVLRKIPLNYFPTSLAMSSDEKFYAVGTKEGLVLLITRMDNNLRSGFNLDVFSGHYDLVKAITFNEDASKLFSSSHSEIIVWKHQFK